MSGRPKMLSSQPKRSWGDSDDENERPEFVLNSEDWPPTPPKPRPTKPSTTAYTSTSTANKGKAVARTVSGAGVKPGSVNFASSASRTGTAPLATTSASRANASATLGRPLVGRKSEPPPRQAQPIIDIPLAPLFSRQRPPSSSAGSSTSSRPMASSSSQSRIAAGSTMFALNNPATAASNGSALPKKRTLPWEELEAVSSRGSRTGSSNFHELSGPSSSGANKRRISSEMKGRLLTSDTIDIKQKVVLSPEQQVVLKLVVEEGKNVFFTGSAGTGKSVLLREIITSLKRKYRGSGDAVAVTASTGMAACNIGGTTIHSFAGIGLGIGPPEQLVSNVMRNKTAKTKWQRVKVLVIDEVSMVDAQLFDKLAYIANRLRQKPGSKNANKPFGGIQLVVTGDFFQLPPVTKVGTPSFAFEAAAWKESIHHTVNLTQVFRQKDTRFIDMLNEMRFGKLSEASIKVFYALSREPKLGDMEPTELFPMRNEVDRANQNRLRALPGIEVKYKADDEVNGSRDPADLQKSTYLQNFMAAETLVIKVGAQVMLIKNLDVDLVNGTIGRVVKIGIPELQDDDDDDENAMMDAGLDPTGARIRASEELRKKKLVADVAKGAVEEAPCVEWQTPSGPLTKWMTREEFKVEDNAGKKLASRKQYPIILAWAMSIHKSQGQTIPCVKVDLGKVFEKGQSYVALSRATSLDGLQVLRFDPSKVMAHETVVNWSKTLRVVTDDSLS
ncbi:hypothetical protein JCM10908_001932 [Rhodotorula pacifica]|uniref:DEAD/DEAH box helicase n=1 Tax=Rhodotorula pacifica TaxID=1495444 RepID=UPI00318251F1